MQAIVIDDTNPRIDYVTAWYHQPGQGTDYNQSVQSHSRTLHATDETRTIAISGNPNSVFEFTFTGAQPTILCNFLSVLMNLGTSISVYGSIPPNNTAISTYTIDLSAPVTFTNPNLTQYTSRQLFFESPVLQDGSHTLTVIAPDSVIGLPWTPVWFDYLTYIPSSSNVTSTSPPSITPTSGTKGLNSDSGGHKLMVILPAVLVPCILVILLVALGIYVGRREKSTARQRQPTPYQSPENGAELYFDFMLALVCLTPSNIFSSSWLLGRSSAASAAPLSTANSALPIMQDGRYAARPEMSLASVVCRTSSEDLSSDSEPGTTTVGQPVSIPPAGPTSAVISHVPTPEVPHSREMQSIEAGSVLAPSIAPEIAPPPYRPRSS